MTPDEPGRAEKVRRWFYNRVLGRFTPQQDERHRRIGHEMWLEMQQWIDDSEPTS